MTNKTAVKKPLEYLSQQVKTERELALAERSWQNYLHNGLHITEDEFFSWLKTWGTENTRSAPKCHK